MNPQAMQNRRFPQHQNFLFKRINPLTLCMHKLSLPFSPSFSLSLPSSLSPSFFLSPLSLALLQPRWAGDPRHGSCPLFHARLGLQINPHIMSPPKPSRPYPFSYTNYFFKFINVFRPQCTLGMQVYVQPFEPRPATEWGGYVTFFSYIVHFRIEA